MNWKDFEKLVQGIYQAFLKQDGFPNIKVEHNYLAKGKSGVEHQIDVYWQFALAGTPQTVLVECKNYNSAVELGNVRDFFGVLTDFPGAMGIIVTRVGFQSGAKQYADHYNIHLRLVQLPISIHVDLSIPIHTITNWQPIIDPAFQQEFKAKHPELAQQKVTVQEEGFDNKLFFTDEAGIPLFSFYDLRSKLIGEFKNTPLEHRTHTFTQPVYLPTQYGPVRIQKIEYDYSMQVTSEPIVIEGNEVGKAIIKDLKTGKKHLFGKDDSLKELPSDGK